MSDVKHFHLDLESESGSTFEFWVDTSSEIKSFLLGSWKWKWFYFKFWVDKSSEIKSTWILSVHQKGLLGVVVCHLLSLNSQMFCFCRCSHDYIQRHFQNWSHLQLFKNISNFNFQVLNPRFSFHEPQLSFVFTFSM